MHRAVLFQRTYGIHDRAAPLVTTPFKLTCNDRSLVFWNVATPRSTGAILPCLFQAGQRASRNNVRRFSGNFLSGVSYTCRNATHLIALDVLMSAGLSLLEAVSSEEGHETLCWSLIKGLVYIRALGSIPVAALLFPYLRLGMLLDSMFLLPIWLKIIPDRLADIILRCRRTFLNAIFVAPTHLVCANWCSPQACIDELSAKVECSVAPIERFFQNSCLHCFSEAIIGAIREEIIFRGLLDWPLWAHRFINKSLEQHCATQDDPFQQEPIDLEDWKAFSFNTFWVFLKSFSFAVMHIGNWLRPGLEYASTKDQKEAFVGATCQATLSFLFSFRQLSEVAETHGLAGAMGAHVTWNAFVTGLFALLTQLGANLPDE